MGAVAQLGERLNGIQEVRGSIPLGSTSDCPQAADKPSLILICDVFEPSTGQAYSRDPRNTAGNAEAYAASSGVGDTAVLGPQAGLFIFDSVLFGTGKAGA